MFRSYGISQVCRAYIALLSTCQLYNPFTSFHFNTFSFLLLIRASEHLNKHKTCSHHFPFKELLINQHCFLLHMNSKFHFFTILRQ